MLDKIARKEIQVFGRAKLNKDWTKETGKLWAELIRFANRNWIFEEDKNDGWKSFQSVNLVYHVHWEVKFATTKNIL